MKKTASFLVEKRKILFCLFDKQPIINRYFYLRLAAEIVHTGFPDEAGDTSDGQ